MNNISILKEATSVARKVTESAIEQRSRERESFLKGIAENAAEEYGATVARFQNSLLEAKRSLGGMDVLGLQESIEYKVLKTQIDLVEQQSEEALEEIKRNYHVAVA